ncbi:hypothetical protein GGX14DRAFT_643291 [Mycena pura]|uniref:Uncharacterized protein n=1 Tax=Mycena pura TaxID=153505 RepID=A0AAD6V929_9AGAR|nr:hypothetical protein GGX14DRAFT_643291 [Mycena pura]
MFNEGRKKKANPGKKERQRLRRARERQQENLAAAPSMSPPFPALHRPWSPPPQSPTFPPLPTLRRPTSPPLATLHRPWSPPPPSPTFPPLPTLRRPTSPPLATLRHPSSQLPPLPALLPAPPPLTLAGPQVTVNVAVDWPAQAAGVTRTTLTSVYRIPAMAAAGAEIHSSFAKTDRLLQGATPLPQLVDMDWKRTEIPWAEEARAPVTVITPAPIIEAPSRPPAQVVAPNASSSGARQQKKKNKGKTAQKQKQKQKPNNGASRRGHSYSGRRWDPYGASGPEDDDDPYEFGFSRGDVEELWCQGVKPWDDDALDVLAVLRGDDGW